MPTTVTKSIGASISPLRDYATHALWIAASPSNLVTADQVWAGQSYNDAAFLVTSQISITGITTDSTRYVDLDVGTGQGWVSAVPAVYGASQSRGVLLTTATAYQDTLLCDIAVFKLHNHQVTNTSNSGRRPLIYRTNGTDPALIENCIFEGIDLGVNIRYGTIRNSLSLILGNNSNPAWYFDYSAVVGIANCGAGRPTDYTAGGTAYDAASGTTPMKNCWSMGFTTYSTASRFSGSNNASDLSSIGFGSSNVTSLAFTTATFVGVTSAGRDFQLLTGSALLDIGITDTTDIPAAVDALGTSRPQGSAWDNGPHELIVAAAPITWVQTQQSAANLSRQFTMIRTGP